MSTETVEDRRSLISIEVPTDWTVLDRKKDVQIYFDNANVGGSRHPDLFFESIDLADFTSRISGAELYRQAIILSGITPEDIISETIVDADIVFAVAVYGGDYRYVVYDPQSTVATVFKTDNLDFFSTNEFQAILDSIEYR